MNSRTAEHPYAEDAKVTQKTQKEDREKQNFF